MRRHYRNRAGNVAPSRQGRQAAPLDEQVGGCAARTDQQTLGVCRRHLVLRAAAGRRARPARIMGEKGDDRPESQYFCRQCFGHFTNQGWTRRSRVFAFLLQTRCRVICPGVGRRLWRTPAEFIDWECRSHGCSDPERHGRMDGSARVAVATNHTRSSRWPMRGMPPARISLRVRGRADVVSVRGSSPTATQPGSICQGLRPDMFAPTAITRRTLPIWWEFPLRVPIGYMR
jgi:hypothetical protein